MSTSGPNWDLDPDAKYLERRQALAPDDPIRRRLDGLEFELERSPWPDGRSWGLETDGPTNKYWVLRSSQEHGVPIVEVVFRVWNQKIIPLDYAVREAVVG